MDAKIQRFNWHEIWTACRKRKTTLIKRRPSRHVEVHV